MGGDLQCPEVDSRMTREQMFLKHTLTCEEGKSQRKQEGQCVDSTVCVESLLPTQMNIVAPSTRQKWKIPLCNLMKDNSNWMDNSIKMCARSTRLCVRAVERVYQIQSHGCSRKKRAWMHVIPKRSWSNVQH